MIEEDTIWEGLQILDRLGLEVSLFLCSTGSENVLSTVSASSVLGTHYLIEGASF